MKLIKDCPLYCICDYCAPKQLLIKNKKDNNCLDYINSFAYGSLKLRNNIIFLNLAQYANLLIIQDSHRFDVISFNKEFIINTNIKLSQIYKFIELIKTKKDLEILKSIPKNIDDFNIFFKYYNLKSFT